MVRGLYVRTLFYGGCAGLNTQNGVMVFRFTKKDNLPCSYPYEPDTEKQSTYNLENASSFTPVCCGHGCGNTSAYLVGAGPFDKIGDCYDERSPYCDVWTEENSSKEWCAVVLSETE